MSYMKRAVKKTVSLENSGTKTLKSASAKISKQEKPSVLQKKTAVIAEKPAKNVKTTETAKKISVPTPKAKKAVSVKVFKQESSVTLKKKSIVSAEKIAGKSKSAIAEKNSVSTPKIQKTITVNQPTKLKKDKIVPPVSVKKVKSEKDKILLKTVNKKVKAVEKRAEIVIPAIRTKSEKTTKSAKIKIEKKIEKKIEIVVPPIMPKPVKKKIKPIGSAVVRGKTGRYDFEIFPLDAELKDGSAIYVISKRITDTGGRGHHKFVCIGQTESLLGDLKKHTKDKCIKQHKANVICLLREENEKNRVKIETDLRQAHTLLACNQQ